MNSTAKRVSRAGLWSAAVILLSAGVTAWAAGGEGGAGGQKGAADTRPAGAAPPRIEPAKDETPVQALVRGCKVYDQLDVGRAMELCRYDERERLLAEAMCIYAVAATRVEQAVRRKFGQAAAAEAVHAIGENVEADIAKAQVTVEGETATVRLPNSDDAFKMVRADGVWKMSVKDQAVGMTDAEVRAEAVTDLAKAAELDKVAAKLEAGKLRTAREVTEAMKRVANPPAAQPGGPV